MPGWTCELEAAVNEDLGLAHWLMSDRSPRVIVLQWDFLNDWHSSLKEETNSPRTLERGWGWEGQLVEVGAVAPRNVAFTQLGV